MDGRKIVSNLFYYFLDYMTITLAGYIFWIAMGKMLIPQQYGILTTVIALWYIVGNVASLGMFEVLPRLVSEEMKRTAVASGIINFSIKASLALSIMFAAVLFFLASQLSRIFYGSEVMTLPIQFLSLIVLTGTPAIIIKGSLQGLQRFKAMFFSDLFGSVIRIAAAIILVLIGMQALGGVAAWSIFFAIVAMACFIQLPRGMPLATFDIRKLLKYSSSSTIFLLSTYFLLQGGVLVLGVLGNMADVGLLGVAVIVGQILLFLSYVITYAILPSLSEMWIREKGRFMRLLSISIKIVLFVTLPFMIIFIVAANWLIRFLYTEAYLAAGSLFPAFMLGTFFFGISNVLLIALYAAGHPRRRTLVVFGSMLFNILLCFKLIPHYGVLGVAYAYLMAQTFLLIASLILLRNIVTLEFSRRSVFIIPILLIFGTIIYFATLPVLFVLKAIIGFLAFVVYSVLVFRLRILSSDDVAIFDYIPNKFIAATMKKMIKSIVPPKRK
ncbi:MAG: oligosaccharide flippase family protein [Candidatus Micrarchaeia archaeon]